MCSIQGGTEKVDKKNCLEIKFVQRLKEWRGDNKEDVKELPHDEVLLCAFEETLNFCSIRNAVKSAADWAVRVGTNFDLSNKSL